MGGGSPMFAGPNAVLYGFIVAGIMITLCMLGFLLLALQDREFRKIDKRFREIANTKIGSLHNLRHPGGQMGSTDVRRSPSK